MSHHPTIRCNLARYRGREIKTTGDGILATFDGPARGVLCACVISDEIRSLGLEVRAGLHTGDRESGSTEPRRGYVPTGTIL